MSESFIDAALDLIAGNRLDEAQVILRKAVDDMPVNWTPIQEDERSISIAFWYEEDFFAYVQQPGFLPDKAVLWVQPSYSMAWYLLGVIASKKQCFDAALFNIDCGIQLEPDHPELWNEKGFIFGRLGRHENSLESYIHAASVRDWAPPEHVARALRGQAVQLIDLKRLDEAEATLRRSLELEPDNDLARGELGYIEQLRREQATAKEKTPWFAHSFVKPPSDPLTIQLIALVEGLPSIPGPKTVGPENYSKIAKAFLERGWEGFEEEFDRIVPRDRPDYADVKRDLLSEPLLSLKAHRNIMRSIRAQTGLSDETLEDVFEDIFRDRKPENPS